MEIIVHAGPMKTGSTYLQVHFREKRQVFSDFSIQCRVFSVDELRGPNILDAIRKAEKSAPDKLILSSEFFSCRDNSDWVLDESVQTLKRKAVLFYRPLEQLYPSLYLQNIKGPQMRISSFEEFIRRQTEIDRDPGTSQGTTFNFAYLDKKLRDEGFEVNWIRYTRNSLLEDFLATLEHDKAGELLKAVKFTSGEIKNRFSQGVSPLRSFLMEMAPTAVEVNKLFREGKITEPVRKRLHASLLDVSDRIKNRIKDDDSIAPDVRDKIRNFDFELNSAFYAHHGSL